MPPGPARDPAKTSDALRLSSCLGNFLAHGLERDGLVVFRAGGQAVVQAAEEAAEQVALGGGVPVAVGSAPVVVGATGWLCFRGTRHASTLILLAAAAGGCTGQATPGFVGNGFIIGVAAHCAGPSATALLPVRVTAACMSGPVARTGFLTDLPAVPQQVCEYGSGRAAGRHATLAQAGSPGS